MRKIANAGSLGKSKASKVIRDPVDTGRKVNVLCTFNLHPVSTGEVC